MISRDRPGFSLLEVLAASALLGLFVVSAAGLLQQSLDTLTRSARAEEDVEAANSLLWEVSLLPADSLWARRGRHTRGRVTASIAPAGAGLFVVVVRRIEDGTIVLSTRLFRPAVTTATTERSE